MGPRMKIDGRSGVGSDSLRAVRRAAINNDGPGCHCMDTGQASSNVLDLVESQNQDRQARSERALSESFDVVVHKLPAPVVAGLARAFAIERN